jgi:hypothetical protein
MADISRRHLTQLGFFLPLAVLSSAKANDATKPEVKWSQAKPIILEYVEKMAEDSKASTGVELTSEQKAQLVDSVVRNMEAQHIYNFVDP